MSFTYWQYISVGSKYKRAKESSVKQDIIWIANLKKVAQVCSYDVSGKRAKR